LVYYVNKGIGGPEINRKIVRKDAEKGIQHQQTPSCARQKTDLSNEKVTDLGGASKKMKN
jgi:hypothetical protein